MPDLTPDVTTTPNFDPGRVAIALGNGTPFTRQPHWPLIPAELA